MDEVAQERAVFGQSCPRCGATIPPKLGGAGRPRVWCSQACRRAAYEERRAARSGAIAVELRDRPAEPPRVVEIETVRYQTREVHHEPTVADALVVVLNDAAASTQLLKGLAMRAATGKMTGPEHVPLIQAAQDLVATLRDPRCPLPGDPHPAPAARPNRAERRRAQRDR